MSYFGTKASFNLRLEVRGRNPEDAWRRAHTAARLVTENANRVTVTALEYSGKHQTPEQRAEMHEARKAIPTTMDAAERADYRRLHKASGLLTYRRDHLQAKLDRSDYVAPENVLKRDNNETWALNVALRVLDGAIRAHEPPRSATPRRGGIDTDESPEGHPAPRGGTHSRVDARRPV